MFLFRSNRNLLRVKMFALSEEELDRPSPRIRELLGMIVLQAMHDGMLAIQMGVDPQTSESFLKYLGPVSYEKDESQWWDMHAPPSWCYPRFLQMVLSLAQLDKQWPVQGVIAARDHNKRFEIQFTMQELGAFQLSWAESLANSEYVAVRYALPYCEPAKD